ncbi:universal stress protein [Rathayibacter sp. VKM Ac-2760]|uniref:universal stress protein n=1 Tax=Rathayibacter sp. VKM Ac-2760 TaxID=2609253 RepID=UPI0013185A5C|nr:universal stress protein [Rathayibacter sp. VKM Ac-2760]QHC60963.1 universal stress protein [Rathayibacter sp. VKM Ac-2760]
MTETILVGVDGSGPSDAATRWAIDRASRLGSRMDVLHATEGVDPSRSVDASRFLLDRAVRTARSHPGVGAVRGLAVDGDPMEQLIAGSADAAIVVVGSHKTGFLRGRLFGSRSLRLVAGALCPVAIIPEPSGRTRHGIAVGVADTPAGERAVRFAAAEAAALGEELTLIHGDAGAQASDIDIDVATAADRLLASARERAIATSPGLVVRVRALRRPAAVALADAAPTSLLLVLAASSGQGRAAVGRTTHDVLMNLAGPTVVVPA